MYTSLAPKLTPLSSSPHTHTHTQTCPFDKGVCCSPNPLTHSLHTHPININQTRRLEGGHVRSHTCRTGRRWEVRALKVIIRSHRGITGMRGLSPNSCQVCKRPIARAMDTDPIVSRWWEDAGTGAGRRFLHPALEARGSRVCPDLLWNNNTGTMLLDRVGISTRTRQERDGRRSGERAG